MDVNPGVRFVQVNIINTFGLMEKVIKTLSNIQLVCYRYNLMKGDMAEKELEFWCKTILSSMND
jgi:hypothetical protein